jgi:ribosome-binding protein aMBF1 (putative translation factor)
MVSYREVGEERRCHVDSQSRTDRVALEHLYDLAMQVVALREKRGLSQAQLARRSGVDQADISRIECGSTSPTGRTLHRIAEALDADVRLVPRS